MTTIREMVRAELKRDPTQRGVDLAKRLGCDPSQISIVRRQMGCMTNKVKTFRVGIRCDLLEFLQTQARREKLTPEQLVNALVVDLKHEVEDQQHG